MRAISLLVLPCQFQEAFKCLRLLGIQRRQIALELRLELTISNRAKHIRPKVLELLWQLDADDLSAFLLQSVLGCEKDPVNLRVTPLEVGDNANGLALQRSKAQRLLKPYFAGCKVEGRSIGLVLTFDYIKDDSLIQHSAGYDTTSVEGKGERNDPCATDQAK
ncbi:hypothetical protein D3C85_1213040 [compost metagenome]